MKYIRRVKKLRFYSKKLPQIRNIHFYIWLSHTENDSVLSSVMYWTDLTLYGQLLL